MTSQGPGLQPDGPNQGRTPLPPCGNPRIVIVGGGVAGLLLATRLGPRLARMRGRVTLVDRSWTHVWKPMLHTFAAGTWDIHQQQVQYLLHARTHGFEYVPGQLAAIDRTAKRVRLAPMHGAGEAIADARELVRRAHPRVRQSRERFRDARGCRALSFHRQPGPS